MRLDRSEYVRLDRSEYGRVDRSEYGRVDRSEYLRVDRSEYGRVDRSEYGRVDRLTSTILTKSSNCRKDTRQHIEAIFTCLSISLLVLLPRLGLTLTSRRRDLIGLQYHGHSSGRYTHG